MSQDASGHDRPGLRIVFFGTPDFAVPALERLIESAHRVVTVVTQPDRPRGRGHRVQAGPIKGIAASHRIPVLQPQRLTEETFVSTFRRTCPDLGVVAAYGRILPTAVLQIPRLGLLNVHASLLPKYRGAAPVQRALMAGEARTGVTIMRVVPELDAGPILAAEDRPIGPDETSDLVEPDLALIGARLLARVVDALAVGPVPERPQRADEASYAPRVRKEEGLIDWESAPEAIHNHVRGLRPWPHAFTYLGPTRHIVLRTRVVGPGALPELKGDDWLWRPGQIVRASGDVLAVATGWRGSVQILEIQPEGRRAMTAREFLAGHAILPGAAFGR